MVPAVSAARGAQADGGTAATADIGGYLQRGFVDSGTGPGGAAGSGGDGGAGGKGGPGGAGGAAFGGGVFVAPGSFSRTTARRWTAPPPTATVARAARQAPAAQAARPASPDPAPPMVCTGKAGTIGASGAAGAAGAAGAGTGNAIFGQQAGTVPSQLTITVQPFPIREGEPYNGTVATFTDTNPQDFSSDFEATIDWGDGSPTTAGTISQPGAPARLSSSPCAHLRLARRLSLARLDPQRDGRHRHARQRSTSAATPITRPRGRSRSIPPTPRSCSRRPTRSSPAR